MKVYQRPTTTKTPLLSDNIMLELSKNKTAHGEGDAGARSLYDLYDEEESDPKDFWDSWY